MPITDINQSPTTSNPSTLTPGSSARTSRSSNDLEDFQVLTNIISTLMENLNNPGLRLSDLAPTSSNAGYDIWAVPSVATSTSRQDPIGTNRDYNISNNNNNQQHPKEDNLNGSPINITSTSVVCSRCEKPSPSIRCQDCNDLFCYECCHKPTSECQLRGHTLLSIRRISPIGVRPNSATNDTDVIYCESHGDQVRYYCQPCNSLICQECTLWMHKDHPCSPMRESGDSHRTGIYRIIEETKTGTKAVKAAIDRALAMRKSYEKESAETVIKVRKSMRCLIQAVEDRERVLLDKVDKMRMTRLNDFSEHMQTLRGILAGLAHTNESLLKSLDLEGTDLFVAKERGRRDVESFATSFKSTYLSEERILFTQPNYELIDQIKRQCDVQHTGLGSMHALSSALCIQPRHSVLHSALSIQSYVPSYMSPSTSLRALPDYSVSHTRSMNYSDNNISSSSLSLDSNVSRGVGQAISGLWVPVGVRPARSAIPGVPVFSFGREGQEEGQVSRPWGLCVDINGNIIVADRRNNRIQIFNCRGEFKTMFGSKGTGPGEFDLPAGITTDILGRIIVIDKDNHRVQIFTSIGKFILKFGSFGKESGQFQYPWDVAVNTLGNIVVTDTRNHRIQLFTSDGTFITKFVFEGANPAKMLKGPTTPRGVCFTTSGDIIVSDFENHRLLMVDPSLTKVLQCVGREGSSITELNRPSGIVSDDEGRIIVADSKNHRVLIFSSDLRILSSVDLKSPGLDDKDRPSDVALTPEGYLVVLFETLPDTARDVGSHGKQYIKVY